MTIKEIVRTATNNTSMVEMIKENLMRAARMLTSSSIEEHSWNYKPKQKTFYTYLHSYDMTGMGCIPEYRYDAFEVNHNGLRLKMAYDNETSGYEYYAYIRQDDVVEGSDVDTFVKKLSERRYEFLNKLKEELAKKATAYLLKHEEEYCKYPTVHRARGGIATRSFIVWACGGSKEENENMRKEEAIEMKETILGRFCYCSTEDLINFDEFYPCVFEDDSETEAIFRLNSYIDLVIWRHRPYYEDVLEAPALYAQFVVKGYHESISPAYTAAVCAAEMHERNECESKFRTFVNDMDKALWLVEEGKYTACVPIIFTQYTDRILEKAQKAYPTDMFAFEIVKRPVPVFSYHHDEDEAAETCIKVTVSNPF